MSLFLVPARYVCSLISSSESSYVLASSAGPSCYHGDESRHRLSAVISCMLPAGIFLDSPLVIICVPAFHHKATLSTSLSLSSALSCSWLLCVSPLDPPLLLCLLAFYPAVTSSSRWQIFSTRQPQSLDLITDPLDGAAINMSHWWPSSTISYSNLLQHIHCYNPPYASFVTSLSSRSPPPSFGPHPPPPSSMPHL